MYLFCLRTERAGALGEKPGVKKKKGVQCLISPLTSGRSDICRWPKTLTDTAEMTSLTHLLLLVGTLVRIRS